MLMVCFNEAVCEQQDYMNENYREKLQKKEIFKKEGKGMRQKKGRHKIIVVSKIAQSNRLDTIWGKKGTKDMSTTTGVETAIKHSDELGKIVRRVVPAKQQSRFGAGVMRYEAILMMYGFECDVRTVRRCMLGVSTVSKSAARAVLFHV